MTEARTNDFLEKEGLGRLMLKYSLPCVISLLVAALYNIVDQIFIANADYLGSFGNAANTVVYPMTVVALAIATMIGDGCCAFVSISLGAKENEKASKGIGSSIICIVISGVILTLIYIIFQEPIIRLFGGDVNRETFELSKEYFFWISVGVLFYMFGQAMNPIIRSDGSPRFAMAILLTGAVINIILDPIFIFVFKWGMMGAAVATILGQIVSAIMSFGYIFKMKAVKLNRASFRLDAGVMKKILPLGMTSFLSQISIVLSMIAVLNMVAKYSALDPVFCAEEYAHIPTAVVGIVMKFFQIVISIAVGLSAGCIPVAGYNIGAGRNDRVKKLMKMLLLTEAAVGLAATVIFELFPYRLAAVFGSANESVYYTDFSVRCIRIFLSMMVLSCVNKGTFIFLQSLGKAKESTALSLMREVVFGVGLPILLPIYFGLNGILYFMPMADILTFLASVAVIAATVKWLDGTASQAYAAEKSENEPEKMKIGKEGVIIAVGRSYGAGGRTIGRAVADRLDIPYYDSELLEKAASESGLSRKFLESMDEKAVKSASIYKYSGFTFGENPKIENAAAKAQREIIEKIGAEGACVIVGRRADRILRDKHKVLSVFVTACEKSRAERVSAREGLDFKESVKKLKKADRERAAYYNQLSEGSWGTADSYDLCIDTDRIGTEGAAELIIQAAKFV